MRARGFTLLEVMLASSIASVVMLTALGMMQYMDRMDSKLARRFEDVSRLGKARESMRIAMASLIAAPDPEPEPGQNQQRLDLARQRFGEGSVADQRFGDKEPPLFALGYTIPNQRSETSPRKIEMRLRRSPLPGVETDRDMIYGAFELVQYMHEPYFSRTGKQSWALLWTPVDPPGEPTILMDSLEFAAWEALQDPVTPQDEMTWSEEHEARCLDDFPRAVHVEMRSWSGAVADWLFEPIIETRNFAPVESARNDS